MRTTKHSSRRGLLQKRGTLAHPSRRASMLFIFLALILVLPNMPRVRARNGEQLMSRLGNSLAPPRDRLIQQYARLPLSFEENEGQLDGRVKFLSRVGGNEIYFTSSEITLSLRKRDSNAGWRSPGDANSRQGRGKFPARVEMR